MDAHLDSSRMTIVERLLKANAVARLELFAAQDDEARVLLVDQLPTAAVQEMLNLEMSLELEDRGWVRAEADRRIQWYLSQSDDELAALDAKTRSEIVGWLDRKTRVQFLNRISVRSKGDILHYDMVRNLNYNVVMTHSKYSPPSIEELLPWHPFTRRGAIVIQQPDVQAELLDGLPTQSKVEMLIDLFQRILDRNIQSELSARNAG